MGKAKTFTAYIGAELDELLDKIRSEMGLSERASRATVFQYAISLLHLALQAHLSGRKLAIIEPTGEIVETVMLPWKNPVWNKPALVDKKTEAAAGR